MGAASASPDVAISHGHWNVLAQIRVAASTQAVIRALYTVDRIHQGRKLQPPLLRAERV